MTRWTDGHDDPTIARFREAYQKMLAGWASDLLNTRKPIAWDETDPQSDYRDRDWRRLYEGSVLDD